MHPSHPPSVTVSFLLRFRGRIQDHNACPVFGSVARMPQIYEEGHSVRGLLPSEILVALFLHISATPSGKMRLSLS